MSVPDLDRARPDDLELVVELEESSFDPREQWSESTWAAELRGFDRLVWVARSGDGGLLGVISCRVVGDSADLHRVVVESSQRRHGLGAALVEQAVRSCRDAGASQLLLEVRADNVAALSLYRRLGFAEIDRRPGYYGRGSDAVVMRRRLERDDD
ncbi:ribosomal protein S18-alanine N-acetyltransferase [Auraticoccus monumenti]|uniref:[Ribosomal protein bS18]-alanine N-acetyltransferase n=1 Tax=Auraticoccus monumenti TaxID=675864 RepID=A0A1G6XH02_9ACTN|nr:ribosomal protein S18-alanine N-acetyltransferase [Auraticoccus monumenti]SDD77499.1 ribosomal-protein-alanine N-acetyltransferase [Auraticoccus monumenti]